MALKNLMREPITQFILIGLALVAINHFWSSYQGEQGRTITVSSAEIERLEKIWANTAGRLPTGEDRAMIIDQFVQEEVLVREAERLGLGFEDTIIRRRLAQKMDFLVSEEAKPDDPSDSALKAWFDDNRNQFAASERRSFIHIYFSPERHGDAIEATANRALEKLKAGSDWQSLGDPFIQKRTYVTLPQSEVTRLFGNDFSPDLYKLKPGPWSAPIGSAFGLHLVKIETVDDAADANLEPIKAEVLAAWQDQQAADGRRAAVEKLVSGYDVVVEGDSPE
jgi:hypothetical protein